MKDLGTNLVFTISFTVVFLFFGFWVNTYYSREKAYIEKGYARCQPVGSGYVTWSKPESCLSINNLSK